MKINEAALRIGFDKFIEQYYSNGNSCLLDDFRRGVKLYLEHTNKHSDADGMSREAVLSALKDAAQIALDRARKTNTKLIIWDGEKIVKHDPTQNTAPEYQDDAWEALRRKYNKPIKT